jgi:hypothetical protein
VPPAAGRPPSRRRRRRKDGFSTLQVRFSSSLHLQLLPEQRLDTIFVVVVVAGDGDWRHIGYKVARPGAIEIVSVSAVSIHSLHT